MKFILSLLLIVIIFTCAFKLKYISEGLCGNYSLTYSKVKDIFAESDISGISLAYNTHYRKDLLTACQ